MNLRSFALALPLLSFFGLACNAAAWSAMMTPPPGAGHAGLGHGTAGAGAAGAGAAATSTACDPAQCEKFCQSDMSCTAPGGWGTKKCEQQCNKLCGNSFFDEVDARLIQCVMEGSQSSYSSNFSCRTTKECCGKDFTSELCRQVK